VIFIPGECNIGFVAIALPCRERNSNDDGTDDYFNTRTPMSPRTAARRVARCVLPLAGLLAVADASALDAAAAEALMKDSGCNKCHGIEKKKDGPAYRDVAAKYSGKPDAEATVTHHVTSGEKVKFDDGHEEAHKKVKTKDQNETRNLVHWILSLQGGKKY
jgi:cytochrome c